MPTRRSFLIMASAGLLLPSAALAGRPRTYATLGYAIGGFDPVAYFTEGAPVEGSNAWLLMWNGAIWRFANERNRLRFEMNPQAFAPRYGGYCAYAVAQGATASTVPEAWTVQEGRLYLNYSLDVRSLWRQDIPGNIARADENWPGVLAG